MEEQKRTGTRHRSVAEAEAYLRDYRASGLTQRRWSARSGVAVTTLQHWIKREREAGSSYALVPVEIAGAVGGGGILDLRVNGLELRVGAGSDLRALAALLRELA